MTKSYSIHHEVAAMRVQYLFIPLISLLFITNLAYADNETQQPAAQEEETLPDAMSRLIKAPDIDIEKVRDPFLSSFDKNRLDEEKRFKSRKQSVTSKRKRDILESFDLSTLTLVGTYKKKDKEWVASIQDTSGKAYTVRRGNYIGKQGGQIEKIDDQNVYIVEQVVSITGEVVDRQVTMTLSEVNTH